MRQMFNDALKEAMKAGEKRRVSTLRLILAGIKERDIEARGAGKGQATDDELLSLLQKMIKQREESIHTYANAGRAEQAEAEREERDIIASYLPKQMDEAQMREAVSAIIAETGAASVKDMGKVMAALKARFAGKMDFSKANGLVKEGLSA